MSEPSFNVRLTSGITQKGDGQFPLMRAKDVDVNGETLLNFIPIILTQTEYDTLVGGGTITLNGQELTYEENRIYMIKKYIETETEDATEEG